MLKSPMSVLDEIFAENGSLSLAAAAYRHRWQQVALARAIYEAMESQQVLIAEAGTGTGKTFAYLVPAILNGGKTIISTGTKTLQDQLYKRDIPAVRDALKIPVTVAMLKGRANYVCHYHLEHAHVEGRFFSREDAEYLPKVVRYAETTLDGDKAGLGEVPEEAGIWSYVTSSRENCLGQECPHLKKCFVMDARKKALEAEIVVVNHHLFFADVMLRDEGLAELLPASNTIILDEAHQLPETASLFFGYSVSTGQFIELARDSIAERARSAPDFDALDPAARLLEKAARDLRLAFHEQTTRLPYDRVSVSPPFISAFGSLLDALKHLSALLESQAQRAPGLENCWRRAVNLIAMLEQWQTEKEYIRWLEVFAHAVQFQATPLSIAEIFQKQLEEKCRTWIFTSATLAVKDDFSHYQKQMGLSQAAAMSWESPFDYPSQALLYVPPNMPEPNSLSYTEALVRAALPVIKASGGRAFLLFTSLRAMRAAYELLKTAFAEEGLPYPLLLQGEQTRTQLLERFRQLGNAVLVASQSFWEGVDVRGDALSLVVIDKLPFAPPDDPVLAARIQHIIQSGGNAFLEYQLPRAIINLKQGAGRLIRDETDRGVLMIGDPRLITKSYGGKIWRSLPPMKRTRDLAEVVEFFSVVAAAAEID